MNKPQWYCKLPLELIQTACVNHGLQMEYVAAIVQVESSGKTFKARFESDRYKDHKLKQALGERTYFIEPKRYAKNLTISVDTEEAFQFTSWGLMQVMGFKARELGYTEDLPMICLPPVGLDLGCKALRKFLDKYDGLYRHAIIAYNAGSVRQDPKNPGKFVSQEYLDKVLSLVEELGNNESKGVV